MLHPDIYQKFEACKRQVFQVKGVKPYQSNVNQDGLKGLWGIAQTTPELLLIESTLLEEVFGPFAVLSPFENENVLQPLFEKMNGQLTISIFTNNALDIHPVLTHFIEEKVGRAIINGVPTGVSVIEAMHHGGAYPASSDARFTAVGPDSILRFTKEVCWQLHQ
jgi:NADP-dependent aldehyde dehydrogenase